VPIFNKFCRIRDCRGEIGGVCITCKKYYPFAQLQGGHFIPSTYSAVQFDERNVNAQCVGCNMFKRGNLIEYFPAMERKYKRKVVDELLSMKHELKKWRTWELEEMIVLYREETKRLQEKYK